ncbi:50S ribosomal protein L13 [Candidatus Falkowbacteria bacterium]|nr:50S ribosomal protein L13 [Candidatus Falkowbacteria bacterium]
MTDRKIHQIDASGEAVGRLASRIALILRGKNKPEYEPHLDRGDTVEVTNIGKIKLTGKKIDQKEYYSYSGYPGGLKTKKVKELLDSDPGEVLRRAVRDMLPPTKLRTGMLKRLIIK